MLRALADAWESGCQLTVAELRERSKARGSHVKSAIQALRCAGLIKSTVRKVEVDNPRKAWAQYVITPAGLAELAKMQRGMQ